MTKFFTRTWPAIALVAGIQTLVLCYIVYDRVMLLSRGREIVAEVIPVDPRDLFRGDYVTLGYAFTRSGDVDVSEATSVGDRIFVTLKQDAPEKWAVAAASRDYPASTAPENVVIKGIVSQVYPKNETSPARASIRYGIESYFVPEGTGRKLEQDVRDKKISAVLAVGASGDVAIKSLKIDGKLVVAEPLL